MKKYGRLLIKIGVVLGLLFLDLWSKALLQDLSHNGVLDIENGICIIPNFFYLNYYENTGAAFSMFVGQQVFLILFTIIMLAIMIVIDWRMKTNNNWFFIGMILFYSGAIGNLIDRIFLQYVRDFIYFTFFPTVFNIADVCLVVGCICIAIYLVFYYSKEKSGQVKVDIKSDTEKDQEQLDSIKERVVVDHRVIEKSQYDKEVHEVKQDDKASNRKE